MARHPLDPPPICARCGKPMPQYSVCESCKATAGKWIPMPPGEKEPK